jgi:hypothetical protein
MKGTLPFFGRGGPTGPDPAPGSKTNSKEKSMSARTGRAIVTSCAGAALIGLVTLGIFAMGALLGDQKPKLFSMGYKGTEEAAGFSGRPMILVFGSQADPSWISFLLSCEADPEFSTLLKEQFVGGLVDVTDEPDVVATYGVEKVGTVIIKDIHGPILGYFEPGFSLKTILQRLKEVSPTLVIEKSTYYAAMLTRGPTVLDDMVANGFTAEATNAVRQLKKFEPTLTTLSQFEAKAAVLGLGQ